MYVTWVWETSRLRCDLREKQKVEGLFVVVVCWTIQWCMTCTGGSSAVNGVAHHSSLSNQLLNLYPHHSTTFLTYRPSPTSGYTYNTEVHALRCTAVQGMHILRNRVTLQFCQQGRVCWRIPTLTRVRLPITSLPRNDETTSEDDEGVRLVLTRRRCRLVRCLGRQGFPLWRGTQNESFGSGGDAEFIQKSTVKWHVGQR